MSAFPVLSLAALTVLETGPLQAIRIASSHGYSHVGLRPVAATLTEAQPAMLTDKAQQAELRATLDGEGIGVLDMEIVRLEPVIDWDRMQRVAEFAALFGARRLLVADNDHDATRSAASLARLAELCAVHEVTPCLEFMAWTCAPNISAARARIAGIPNVALLIDAYHLARSGGSPDDLSSADCISYVQLCDIAGPIPPMDEIPGEARANRLFPGEGEIDLAGLLRAVPGRPISLEIPAERLRDAGVGAAERARRAIVTTRQLLARVAADG